MSRPQKRKKRTEQVPGGSAGTPLTLASAPHLTTRDTTRTLMLDVLIALMPALLFSGATSSAPGPPGDPGVCGRMCEL